MNIQVKYDKIMFISQAEALKREVNFLPYSSRS